LAGCVTPPDPGIHKACLFVLREFISFWHANTGGGDPALQTFTMGEVCTSSLECLLLPHLDLKDAATSQLLKEIALLHIALAKLWESIFLEHLGPHMIDRVGLAPEGVRKYCLAVSGGQTAPAKQALVELRKSRDAHTHLRP
jgi:hypothetical protein